MHPNSQLKTQVESYFFFFFFLIIKLDSAKMHMHVFALLFKTNANQFLLQFQNFPPNYHDYLISQCNQQARLSKCAGNASFTFPQEA